MNKDYLSSSYETVRFLSQGDGLVGRLFLPNTSGCFPTVLVCHGLFGFKDKYSELAEFLVNHGIAVLAMDMHGHGESGGERFVFHLPTWIADIQAGLNFLTTHERIDSTRIAGFGVSSGATALLEAALVEPRLKALITLSASVQNHCTFLETIALYISLSLGIIHKKFTQRNFRLSLLRELNKTEFTFDPAINASWRAESRVQQAFASMPFPGTAEAHLIDTIKCVGKILVPTLVLHGAEDRVEPLHSAQDFYEALTCEKAIHIIPDTGHLGHLDRNRKKIFELTTEWVKSKLFKSETSSQISLDKS